MSASTTTTQLHADGLGSAADLLEDLSIYLIAGRVKGGADQGGPQGPARALLEAADAERMGFRRVFLSERYDLKDAGAILGGVAATTTRLGIATGAVTAMSRHPLVMASMAATLQATYGERFVLGLGRGSAHPGKHAHPFSASYRQFEDYIDIVRRLLRGETVSYEGPVGSFENLRMLDKLESTPPEIWSVVMGGAVASRVAAKISDAVMLSPMMTPEASAAAVSRIRAERDKLGLDPSIRICQPVVTAPEFDEDKALDVTSARLLTYVVGLPGFAKALSDLNGWDLEIMQSIERHPLFTSMDSNADQSFYRSQLLAPAKMVPASWMHESCATGSIANCVARLQDFRDAGVDEIAVYGSTPADNAKLVTAWRRNTDPSEGE